MFGCIEPLLYPLSYGGAIATVTPRLAAFRSRYGTESPFIDGTSPCAYTTTGM